MGLLITGRLYTWYAVTDSRNVCPSGWHVPTDAEWTTLVDYLIANGYNFDGTTSGNKIAKALAATTNWTFNPAQGAPGIRIILQKGMLPALLPYREATVTMVSLVVLATMGTGGVLPSIMPVKPGIDTCTTK